MAAQRKREADHRKPRMKNSRTQVLVEILAPFFFKNLPPSPFGGGALFFFIGRVTVSPSTRAIRGAFPYQLLEYVV